MHWTQLILAVLIGYLLGSIPFGYLIGRMRGVDVTKHASGRTGGTNVYRALGKRFGLMTGALDFVKGAAAVLIVRSLFGNEVAAALAGAMAVFGHNWSVFLRFRGGAGGSTGAGALLALNPLAGAILLPIFLFVLFVVRIASVATMTVGVGSIIILLAFYVFGVSPASGLHPALAQLPFGLLVSVGIFWSLRPNIARLLAGNERRIELR
ncbi:MAG: glycerol-3-phosphate 1-O-acyltransferase [Caldilineae bacterium]|nr:MAG: glycerol-3-phosphate 1-O-acyltransferase [Caldilineae bacterium]